LEKGLNEELILFRRLRFPPQADHAQGISTHLLDLANYS